MFIKGLRGTLAGRLGLIPNHVAFVCPTYRSVCPSSEVGARDWVSVSESHFGDDVAGEFVAFVLRE